MALCPGTTDTKLVRDVNRKLLLARYEDAWQKDIVSSIPQRYIYFNITISLST